MLSDLELNLLAGFFPHPSCCLLKYLERKCRHPSEKVYPALISLEERDVVRRRSSGRSVIYSLNTEKEEAFHGFLSYVRLRHEEFRSSYPVEEQIAVEFSNRVGVELVVLFGEHAISEASPEDSDINLLLVSISRLRDEKEIENLRYELENGYGRRISLVLMNELEFRKIKSMGTEYYGHIVNFGFPLKGHRLFYDLVFMEEEEK